MAYARRDIRGGAVETSLSGAISGTPATFSIASATGWPDGTAGPFIVAIDRPHDTSGETNASFEKILCTSRASTTVTIGTRGYDGTSSTDHSSGARVEHIIGAVDIDEANYAVSKTVGKVTAAGDVLVGDGANSLAAVASGTSGRILVGNGTTLASVAVSGDATLASTGVLTIANSAVTSAKIATNAVTATQIATDAVGSAEIAADAVTSAEIATDAVGSAEIAANAVTSSELADNAVDTAAIADGSVTLAKIAAVVQQALVPTGSIVPYAGQEAGGIPSGWIICAGGAISRTTFSALFAVIGTTYGAGDGSTTFNLPDLRARVLVGLDNMGGLDAGRLSVANTLGGTGGEQDHTLTVSELAAHSHGTQNNESIVYADLGGGNIYGGGTIGHATANNTAVTGGGTAHNNMQPYMLVNHIIKA